ncbi:MAG TPA: methyltransferase [Polyangiales bacterium]|nr:methyltransferase [Polyangiales bacterium]
MTRTSTQVTPDLLLMQMVMGFRMTQLLHVAAKLNIADQLAGGSKSARELAKSCGCNADALYRTLRALSNLGVLVELGQERFRLTPLGEHLRAGVPGSLHGAALLYGEPWLWNAYGHLLHSVQTGKPAFEHTHGSSFFDYLSEQPDAAEVFNAAMTSFSEQETAALLRAYDFSNVRHVLDVGGGHGRLAAALLRAHPNLRATLFDRPQVVSGASELQEAEGLGARCTIVAGNFFEAVPAGADVYLLKSVIHDWDDDKATQILKRCREAMAPESRLLVVERVVGDPGEVSEAKLFDINMLTMLGGRERTQFEHQALLATAGLRLTRLISTQSPLTVLEAMQI